MAINKRNNFNDLAGKQYGRFQEYEYGNNTKEQFEEFLVQYGEEYSKC